MEQFDAAEQTGTLDQLDELVSTLQELDVTDEGRDALVAIEAHVSGGLI